MYYTTKKVVMFYNLIEFLFHEENGSFDWVRNIEFVYKEQKILKNKVFGSLCLN